MTIEDIFIKLKEKFPDIKECEEKIKNYPSWFLPSDLIFQVIETLKNEFGFVYLDMVTAVDRSGKVNPQGYITSVNPNIYLQTESSQSGSDAKGTATPQQNNFFQLVFLLTSFTLKQKIFLVTTIDRENPHIESLYKIFKSADWQEREIFDLFGIKFRGHPNLKKILTPEFIEGFPLRKDYVHKKDMFD